MNENIEFIQKIADKKLTYNKDINQHIGSCRISMNIINEKEETIKILNDLIARKDEEIRKLVEEKFLIEIRTDTKINELKEVLNEQYKLINDLMKK